MRIELRTAAAALTLVAVLAFVVGTAGAAPAALQDDDQQGNATRAGADLVLSVPAESVGEAGNATSFSVTVPEADGSATVDAERDGDRYVARIPVADVVSRNATADLSSATVLASHGETEVLDDTADLRYVAQTGPATFRGSTLAIPADVRGLGNASTALVATDDGRSTDATVDGIGPNATLLASPATLANLPIDRTVTAAVTAGNDTVPSDPIEFTVADAAARGTSIEYRDGDPVLVQPLAHPDLGPERIELTVATEGPRGVFHVRTDGPEPSVSIPASVVGANDVQVRVERGFDDGAADPAADGSPLLDVGVSAPGRATVSLRIANGSIQASDPAALDEFDAVLVRDAGVTYVPIESALRSGGRQELPASITEPSQDATAILVGDGVRPARVDLTVLPPPAESESEDSAPDPGGQEFVALWTDIGSIVSLLFVAMVGSVLSVGSIYGLRRLSPARSAAAGPRAVAGHFVFGGIAGIACIEIVQSLYWEPVLGSVTVAGRNLGLGALLVGSFHGGLTATGLRLGLGTVEAWPTRRVIDETAVPVRVRFTDDEGESLPGEQTIEVRQATDGSIVETAGLAGTTTEVELPAGEYAILGQTAERESDAVDIAIEEPETPRPETRSVHLTVGRPGLQIEVTDAQTGNAIPEGQVTVTTDRDETRAAEIDDGSVSTSLPVATAEVSAVVSAPGYDETTVETPIEEELTTVDVALDPASGTLVVSTQVAGKPIADATVTVEPADDSAEGVDDQERSIDGADAAAPKPTDGDGPTPNVGVRTGEATTDETGTARLELPAGRYRATLVLEGPNAERFATKDGVATVEPDAETPVTVHARFDWEPGERVRRRAAGLRKTIRSVAEQATADPTIPLYFAGVTEALLDCVGDLSASGHQFATSSQDPDEVAAATVAAAEEALEAVGQAMQVEGVREVMVRSSQEPTKPSPNLDASPAELLAYLEQDLAIASVEARAHEVEQTIDAEADRLASVAPARAVLQKAVGLVGEGEPSTHAAAREFAALLLLDVVEQGLARSEIRSRLE